MNEYDFPAALERLFGQGDMITQRMVDEELRKAYAAGCANETYRLAKLPDAPIHPGWSKVHEVGGSGRLFYRHSRYVDRWMREGTDRHFSWSEILAMCPEGVRVYGEERTAEE